MSVDPSISTFNLNNTITAPTTNRKLFAAAGASETNTHDEDLESDDIFDLRLIDYARERADASGVPIRPIMINGEEKYVCYLHPWQVTDLRTSTDTGQWQDIQKAALMGGAGSKSPLYNGSLGEYNGVILRVSNDVPYGVNSTTGAAITTVRRAVFLGAQSAVIAFGTDFSPGTNGFKWIEKTFDYERELGVSVQSLIGLKKTTFNSEDFGSVVISTWAAAHG